MNFNEYMKNMEFRLRKFNNKNIMFSSNSCFEVNEIGREIWKNIGKDIEVESIVNSISEEYSVDESIIKEDVLKYINKLLSLSIILKA